MQYLLCASMSRDPFASLYIYTLSIPIHTYIYTVIQLYTREIIPKSEETVKEMKTKMNTLPETNASLLKIGLLTQKGKDHLLTINFQVLLLMEEILHHLGCKK